MAFRDVFVLPKTLPLAAGALLLSWEAASRAWRSSPPKPSIMSPGIVMLAISMLASTLLSIDIPMSILGPHQSQFYAVLPFLLCVTIFYGVRGSEITPDEAMQAAMVAAVPVSAWAIMQGLGRDPWMGWALQDGRAGGPFGSPIFMGSFLGCVLPICWHVIIVKPWRQGLAAIWCAILIIGALVAGRSRGGALSGVCGIVLYQALVSSSILVPAAALLGTVAMAARQLYHPPSDLARAEVWRIAVSIWKKYPFFGCGPDAFGVAFRNVMTKRFVLLTGNDVTIQMSAHNDILQVISTLGLFGLLAYAIFMACGAIVIRRELRRNSAAPAIAAALFAIFVQAKVNPITLYTMALASALLASIDWEPCIE